MTPFLYLDNYREAQPETRFDRALAKTGLPVVRARTNEGRFPVGEEFCGVYVSPSFNGVHDDEPWIRREQELLRRLAHSGIPMLGLCFGSQILASSLFGPDLVFTRGHRESGRGTIRLRNAVPNDDPLTVGLPEIIPVFHWHGDEVRADHPGMRVLASNSACPNQIWRWRHGPVWGVQPHAEFDRTKIGAWLRFNRTEFLGDAFDGDQMETSGEEYEVAGNMLENFLSVVERGVSTGASRSTTD